MKRLYKNWTFHNLIAHPLLEIAFLITRPFSKDKANRISELIHDATLPKGYEV